MNNELYVVRAEKLFRKLSDRVLFDIRKINWNPSYEILEKFCKETYYSIVEKYKELEETQEYFFTGKILYAKSCSRNIDLAFVVGEGFTKRESVSTHSLGWGLEELLKKQKINSEPFNFKLLIVGYKGINNGGGESLPILDEIVNF